MTSPGDCCLISVTENAVVNLGGAEPPGLNCDYSSTTTCVAPADPDNGSFADTCATGQTLLSGNTCTPACSTGCESFQPGWRPLPSAFTRDDSNGDVPS